jgi:pantoate--beta-alanine ligase
MSAPVVASTRAELAALLAEARRCGQRVGLVPTMGALHEGHASLMRVARDAVRSESGTEGKVVVSIFVNPLQFGPGEDLDRYPRTLQADLVIAEQEGVDIVFAPSVDEVYPRGLSTDLTSGGVTLHPGPLGSILEGRTRPGHFAGMLVVVAKLFGLVRPDVAVFGEKDYQQLALIRRMVEDLCMGIEIVGAPTQREHDGLALSSRNRYLDAEQRLEAVHLSRALFAAQKDAEYGVHAALDAARAELRRAKSVDLDYLVVTGTDLRDLPEQVPAGTEARILVAARVGTTRLIDNMSLTIGSPTGSGSTP